MGTQKGREDSTAQHSTAATSGQLILIVVLPKLIGEKEGKKGEKGAGSPTVLYSTALTTLHYTTEWVWGKKERL